MQDLNYVGIVRIIKIEFEYPTLEIDSKANLHLLLAVMIQEHEGVKYGKKLYDLKMNVLESGEAPQLGEMVYVMIKNNKIRLLD